MMGTHSTPHPVWEGASTKGVHGFCSPHLPSHPDLLTLPSQLGLVFQGGSLWIVPDTSVQGVWGGAWKSGTTGCGSGCLSGEGGLPGRVAGAGSYQGGHPPTPDHSSEVARIRLKTDFVLLWQWLSPTLDSAWTMGGLFQGSEASWSEVVPSLTGKEDSGGQQCLSVPVIAGGFYEPVTGLSPAASLPFCPSLGTYSWGRAVLGVVWARGSGGCSGGRAQLQQELARVACLLAGWGRWLFWAERP